MGHARGIDTVLAIGEESTYGTAATGNFVKVCYISESVAATRNLIDDPTLCSTTRQRAQPADGNWNVAGDITVACNAESMLYLMKHAIDTPTKSGSAAPYTFTYVPGALPIGFTMELDYGSQISGAGRVKQLVGCRVNEWGLTIPQEGLVTCRFGIVGAAPTVPMLSALTDSTPATISTHQAFSAFDVIFTVNSHSFIHAQSIDLTYSNNLDQSGHVIGGAGKRGSLPEGFATLTGTLTALLDSTATSLEPTTDVINDALAGTVGTIEIAIQRGTGAGGSVGNEGLSLSFQCVWEPILAVVPGPEGIFVSIPFRAYYGTESITLVAAIPTDISTIPAS